MIGCIDNANPGVMRIPYGLFAHPSGITQVFNRQVAANLERVRSGSPWEWAKSVLRNGWHRLSGKNPPVVIGHPPGENPPSYGAISRIVPLDNEAEFHVDWKPEGRALVSGESPRFTKFSPRWKYQQRGGLAVPFALEHMGLTNRPVIPVPAIDNAEGGVDLDESEAADLDNSTTVLGDHSGAVNHDAVPVPGEALRSLRGKLCLPEDATMEQVIAAIETRAALAREQEAAVAALVRQLAAGQQAASADNELAATRASLVERCLKAHQAGGRLLPRDYAAELSRIAALSNEQACQALDAIAARAPLLKTTSLMEPGTARQARGMTLENEALREPFNPGLLSRMQAESERLKAAGVPADKAWDQAFAATVHHALPVA